MVVVLKRKFRLIYGLIHGLVKFNDVFGGLTSYRWFMLDTNVLVQNGFMLVSSRFMNCNNALRWLVVHDRNEWWSQRLVRWYIGCYLRKPNELLFANATEPLKPCSIINHRIIARVCCLLCFPWSKIRANNYCRVYKLQISDLLQLSNHPTGRV